MDGDKTPDELVSGITFAEERLRTPKSRNRTVFDTESVNLRRPHWMMNRYSEPDETETDNGCFNSWGSAPCDGNNENWESSEENGSSSSSSSQVCFPIDELTNFQLRFIFFVVKEDFPSSFNEYTEHVFNMAIEKYCDRYNLPRMSFDALRHHNLLPDCFNGNIDHVKMNMRRKVKQFKMNITKACNNPNMNFYQTSNFADDQLNWGSPVRPEMPNVGFQILPLAGNDDPIARQIRFIFEEAEMSVPNVINQSTLQCNPAVIAYCEKYGLPQMTFDNLQSQGLLPTKFYDNDIERTRNEVRGNIDLFLMVNSNEEEYRPDCGYVENQEDAVNLNATWTGEGQDNVDNVNVSENLEQLMADDLKEPKAVVFFERLENIKIGKDDAASFESRRKAREILSPKQRLNSDELERVFALNTKSIAQAPLDSVALSRAYNSRSTLLLLMNKFEESIKDIDRALAISLSDDVVFKASLLFRKMECLVALNRPETEAERMKNFAVYKKLYADAVNYLDKAKVNTLDESIENALDEADRIIISEKTKLAKPLNVDTSTKKPKIHEHVKIYHNRRENSWNDDVEITTDGYVKHLFAKRDFLPGDIVYTEKPLLAWFDTNNVQTNCSYCFVKSWACIPCDVCSWCLFCSEDCKQKAWAKYHDLECTVVSYALESSHTFTYHDFLALRCLLEAVKESGSLLSFRARVEALEERMNDFDSFELSLSGFECIYGLSTVVTVQEIEKASVSVSNCEKLLVILAKKTNFFGERMNFNSTLNLAENEDVLFCGKVFLKLRQNIVSCAHVLHNLKSTCSGAFSDTENCMRRGKCKGACLTPLSCLIDQSCHPNAKVLITNHMQLVLFALRPIKAGSKLCVSYELTFLEQEDVDRKELIKKYLKFNCECEACTLCWPTLHEMYEMPTKNTELYCDRYWIPQHIKMFHELSDFVRPILKCQKGTKVSQKTVQRLSKAMVDAVVYSRDNAPSVVVGELMLCISKVLDNIYSIMD